MSEKNKKRIGIDARFLGEAGPGRYVKNIIEQLEVSDTINEYLVYLRPKGFELYHPSVPNFQKVKADYKWYSWGEQIGFLFLLLRGKLDIFYVPHFNIPVLYPGRLITAIPDIIMHFFSTERGTTLPKYYFKFKKWIYRLVVWWAVKRSYRVIVPSLDVRDDFLKVYPHEKENKFVLAYEGVDPILAESKRDIPEFMDEFGIRPPYFLYISSMYEHKNVPFLLNTFQKFIEKTGKDYQLVLIGKRDNYSEKIFSLIQHKGLEESVKMPGLTRYINDEETVYLRKNASAYIFPSLKEGFSLTPLEAQTVGIPCVISDIPCHREIYGDTVLYFDPRRENDAIEKMEIICTNTELRNSLIYKGYENIKKYSWKNTGEITLRVFHDLLKDS